MRLRNKTSPPSLLNLSFKGSILVLLTTVSGCAQYPEKPKSNGNSSASITSASQPSLGNPPSSVRQNTEILDANSHPPSPEFKSAFTAMTIPLDATLSWTNRFTGDENFNESEVLAPMIAEDKAGITLQPSAKAMASKGSNNDWDTTGIVKSVRLENGKIKIKHEAIDSLGMPAMTMVFTVQDKALLTGFEDNQEVGFNVENTAGGFFITNIARLENNSDSLPEKTPNTAGGAESSASASMDARGIVKTIRAEQGKVKIQHGPIERLGMPGMTMMFSVKDPALLQGVTKGAEVDFTVDNTALLALCHFSVRLSCYQRVRQSRKMEAYQMLRRFSVIDWIAEYSYPCPGHRTQSRELKSRIY